MHSADGLSFFKVERVHVRGLDLDLYARKRLAVVVGVRGPQTREALFIDRIVHFPDHFFIFQGSSRDPASSPHGNQRTACPEFHTRVIFPLRLIFLIFTEASSASK